MARPTTKTDLIAAADETYHKLMKLLDSLSQEERTGNFSFDLVKEKGAHWGRDKNIRDVLVHLYEWHQLLLHWVEANRQGKQQNFLLEGYNWRNYGDMNIELRDKHQQTSYETALALFSESHEQVMALAGSFSNEELFSKGAFPWTGGSTLGSYFVSSTSSHYEWALKKIRKYKKMCQ
ncbi:hypothetical protein KIMH_07700 [Bombiscardovia apis]|uniref:ClbS/DfsB family four-helix bundle protein n=1 Tax=Bombiscardovia apis TaxID=2932182 RepID=A0ABM8BCN4_9BIFI|nr:ClbS/DfsB family four-helix bundle protein [Bombiscardovia apis]BDR54659.1 hypothetical protein KIMH_07700 [Bombiscardovia apis]